METKTALLSAVLAAIPTVMIVLITLAVIALVTQFVHKDDNDRTPRQTVLAALPFTTTGGLLFFVVLASLLYYGFVNYKHPNSQPSPKKSSKQRHLVNNPNP